jgi:seryl-tRNA synthetase
MLDIQLLRKDLPAAVAGLKRRGFDFTEDDFKALEEERRKLQSRTEELQGKRNTLSKQVGILKGKGEDASAVLKEVGGIGDELKSNEAALGAVQDKMAAFLRVIPNIPRADVPDGRNEHDNVEVRRWGEPRKFDFPAKDHVDIGEGLKGMDFETAAKIAGARFYVLKAGIARLHRAIAQLMLQMHTEEHGYTEVYVPYMVNARAADVPSSLAKFREDLF